MSLDTEIEGSPIAIETAASWLRDDLAAGVEGASTALVTARRHVGNGWDGQAAAGFRGWSGEAVRSVDELSTGLGSVAVAMEGFASSLRTAQSRMAGIRASAGAAGLTVSGFLIADPGVGPAHPGVVAPGAKVPAGHAAAGAGFDLHEARVRAWNVAVAAVEAVHAYVREASQRLQGDYRGLEGHHWFTAGGDLLGGLGGAVVQFQSSILRGTSDELLRSARYYEDLAKNADPAVVGPGRFYADLQHATTDVRRLEGLGRQADDLDVRASGVPIKLGGALSVVGIGFDVAGGKDPLQAGAAGFGGFGASVAAGALVGTAIGGPVGTVAGTVVGAGVGIFTSGMIDGMFEHGGDMSEAFEDGVDSVTDTAQAIGDGIGGAIDDLGGLLD